MQDPLHQPTNRNCEGTLGECIIGTVIGAVIGPPIAHLANTLLSDARISSTVGTPANLGLRVGRTVRYNSPYRPVVYPYAALGIRAQDAPTRFSNRPSREVVFLEVAGGLRTALSTWHPEPPAWIERLHLTTEVQWLRNGSEPNQIWLEIAPDVTLTQQDQQRVSLQAIFSVSIHGERRGLIQPGIDLSAHW